MLEITRDNCNKCHLETITDPNNSQYFGINRRDLEIETERNWQAIFDKCKDSSTQKYRKKLAPNITFQHNKIFVRNDLLEIIMGITKLCTYHHPAPFTSTQLILASTQLSATPSTIFEPKYCT